MSPFSAGTADDPFETRRSGQRVSPPSPWPLWTLWGLSAAGLVVSLFANTQWSAIAFGVLSVAGAALLYWYRMSLVDATRQLDADASVVGIKPLEKLTIWLLVLSCVANGFVIGLWVGSWEFWV